MGKARQFAQNSFWLMVSSFSILLVGAIYRPILGRILGPEEYGRYSFIQTFVNYFVVLAFLGIRQVVAREIGRDRSIARACVVTASKLRAVTIIIAIAACCSAGYALQRGHEVTVGIFVLSISIGALVFGDLLESVLVSIQRSMYIAISNLTGNLLRLGVGIWALTSGYGLITVLWIFVGASAVTTAMEWVFVRKALASEKQRPAEPGFLWFILKQGLQFFVIDVTTRLYNKNDVLFLALIAGDKVTGFYCAAYVFVDVMININNNCAQAAYPMISRIHGGGNSEKAALDVAYERLHKHMLMISLPMAVLFTLLGREIVLVFGPEFAQAASALHVLAWTPPLDISIVTSGIFLCATYRQSLVAKIESVMMVVNAAWTVSFILMYGAMGAAIATVGAAVVNAVVRHIYIRRHIGRPSHVNTWIKPLACAAIMMLMAFSVWNAVWPVRLGVLLFGYAAALAVIRPYDKEDWRLIRSVAGR